MKPSFTELRERLLVQKKNSVADDFGGLVESYEDYKDVWAMVEFVSAKDITGRSLKDILKSSSVLRKSLYRVTLRLEEAFPEHLRFIRGEKMLQVISHPIKKEGYMTLYACECYS